MGKVGYIDGSVGYLVKQGKCELIDRLPDPLSPFLASVMPFRLFLIRKGDTCMVLRSVIVLGEMIKYEERCEQVYNHPVS